MSIRDWSQSQVRLVWAVGLLLAIGLGVLIDGYLIREANPFYAGSGRFLSDAVVTCVLIVIVALSVVTWRWLGSRRR